MCASVETFPNDKTAVCCEAEIHAKTVSGVLTHTAGAIVPFLLACVY